MPDTGLTPAERSMRAKIAAHTSWANTENPSARTAPARKAALDKLVEAWRAEHPQVGFTRVVVGDCAGGDGHSMTEFASTWDPELATEVASVWVAREYLAGALLDADELVGVIDNVLRCGPTASIPSVAVVPRPPA